MTSYSWWTNTNIPDIAKNEAMKAINHKIKELGFSPEQGSSTLIDVNGQTHIVSLYQDELAQIFKQQDQLAAVEEPSLDLPKRVRAECAILRPGAIPPIRKRPTDAGYDILSQVDLDLPPRGNVDVASGIAISVQRGYYFTVEGRSGLGVKYRIVPFTGTIDACYVGELWVMLTNNSDEHFYVNKGDRIAQLIVKEQIDLDIVIVDQFSDEYKSRGTAGFGSSGR